MKIRPLFDKIVLAPREKQDISQGGILLSSLIDDKSQIAKVVAVGEGGLPDGKDLEIRVKVGDNVLFAKYSGVECEIDGKKVVIVRQADILAVIE